MTEIRFLRKRRDNPFLGTPLKHWFSLKSVSVVTFLRRRHSTNVLTYLDNLATVVEHFVSVNVYLHTLVQHMHAFACGIVSFCTTEFSTVILYSNL